MRRSRRNYSNFNKSKKRKQDNSREEGDQFHDEDSLQTITQSVRPSQALANCPYKGWKLYFPNQDYVETSDTVDNLKMFQEYFLQLFPTIDLAELKTKRSFYVEFKELLKSEIISAKMANFSRDLRDNPETLLQLMGLALHHLASQKLEEIKNSNPVLAVDGDLPAVTCRIRNYGPLTSRKHLKTNYYGKYVAVRGTVIRMSATKPLCAQLAFECGTCGTIFPFQTPEGNHATPSGCPGTRCKGRTFHPVQGSPLTRLIAWQSIRVQEVTTDDLSEAGRIPRMIECELTEDLVDSCSPGDIVTVSGIVKMNNAEEGKQQDKEKCAFVLYILANAVLNERMKRSDEDSNKLALSQLSMKEKMFIQELKSDPDLFRTVVNSLCSIIYGHEMVKAGLILGLFGGTSRYSFDNKKQNAIPVRSDPHILVVGDPGMGKSQMLQACTNVSPRGVYVCGNATTAAGLTVSLTRNGADSIIEAGALVQADQGVCCIDELDKMGSHQQVLLDVMEQQTVTIAKSGFSGSMYARATVLAVANPTGGHYDRSRTVADNIKMTSALLSRFDLIFILIDKPDETKDVELSEYLMEQHLGRRSHGGSVSSFHSNSEHSVMLDGSQVERPLSERLRIKRGEPFDPIPPLMLRKFIDYARKNCRPTLSPEAGQILYGFYLDLRKRYHLQDSTPITTRQLESLRRLAEARAKVELCETVTEQHACDVIELMKHSMVDTLGEDHGILPTERNQKGSGKMAKAKKFISILQRTAEKNYNSLFNMQQLRQIAEEYNLQIDDFERFIESLNNQGFLLKKGPRVYQLQTFGY